MCLMQFTVFSWEFMHKSIPNFCSKPFPCFLVCFFAYLMASDAIHLEFSFRFNRLWFWTEISCVFGIEWHTRGCASLDILLRGMRKEGGKLKTIEVMSDCVCIFILVKGRRNWSHYSSSNRKYSTTSIFFQIRKRN